MPAVGQGAVKDMDGLSAAPRGGINLRQIQVQLGLISFHAQGRLAQFQRLIPLSMRPGDADSEKREIVRIRLRPIQGMTKIFNRITRIAIAHQSQCVFELGDSGSVFHISPWCLGICRLDDGTHDKATPVR